MAQPLLDQKTRKALWKACEKKPQRIPALAAKYGVSAAVITRALNGAKFTRIEGARGRPYEVSTAGIAYPAA